MGYKLVEHKQYDITGKTGTKYMIPSMLDLSFEDFEVLSEYDRSEDASEKAKLSKEILLRILPELENEEIGDMEYPNIFLDYLNWNKRQNKKELGES